MLAPFAFLSLRLLCCQIDEYSGALKLQKEREKAKKEKRKEKKREKKEKKKKPIEDDGKTNKEKHSHKKRHYNERSQLSQQGESYTKIREDEIEQLEKSSLTEEQGLPAVQNLCYSSDSTQNSSKRKKHEATDVGHNNHGCGLRIRLPLMKHKDPEPPTSIEQPCFSGRTEATLAQERNETARTKPSFFGSTSSSSGLDFEEQQFRDLIVNFNLPPLQMEHPDFDNQEWLFGAKKRQHSEHAVSRCQVDRKDLGHGSALCSWAPQACYLPDADRHALPFVVPF